MTADIVKDISLILRRDCPSEKEIIKGCNTVENHDDNIWPLNGEHDPEVAESRWDKRMIPNKRRKVEGSEAEDKLSRSYAPTYTSNVSARSSIGTTTMENRSSFSCQGTNGFVSAATQLHHVNEDIQARKSAAEKRRIPMDSLGGEKQREVYPRIPKETKTGEGQGTLQSFWAERTETNGHGKTTALPQDSLPYTHQRSHIGSKQISKVAALSKEVQRSGTSLAVIPKGLADHKLHSLPVTSRPYLPASERSSNSKHYVFLSSSPPRVPDPQKDSNTSSDILPSAGFKNKLGINSSKPGNVDDIRPATTFHTTSLAQLRAASNVPKKTLGVRRSMTGWPPRENQGFSIPSRTNVP